MWLKLATDQPPTQFFYDAAAAAAADLLNYNFNTCDFENRFFSSLLVNDDGAGCNEAPGVRSATPHTKTTHTDTAVAVHRERLLAVISVVDATACLFYQ